MKSRAAASIIIFTILAASAFANSYARPRQALAIVRSSGTVDYDESPPLRVILRDVNLQAMSPPANIDAWVDSYAANHTYATAVTLSDFHQYGIWWYGYSFSNSSGTWMGWTFQQLKTFIDRLHHDGLEVGLETTGVAWESQEEYNYITSLHPELAFTDANGLMASGIDNDTATTKNPGWARVIPDFFAKFATADSVNNIPVGTRLIDLYTSRLDQMIADGLQWDFWFGTDGWNGFNMQGYYWNSRSASQCYSFSLQEENEYAAWTPTGMSPSNWGIMNNVQRAATIVQNSTLLNNWWWYWQTRFAQMYAQIRQVFIDSGRPGPFYLIGSADESSEPGSGGNLSPTGMYNMTLLAQYNSADYIYVDQEATQRVGATYALGREQTYVGALVKMQSPNLKPIIGLQPVDWLGNSYPLWEVEQEYLSQAINYVWHNGQRYRVSDPSIIMMQYPSFAGWAGWGPSDVNSLFNFINSTRASLQNANPLWLGPVYPISDTKSGSFGQAWWGVNFTFAQWAWTSNLQNNPQYINQTMGTFLLDEALGDSGPQLTGLYDVMVNQLWANNSLNLWYYECRGLDWRISEVWGGNGQEAENAFHIIYSPGNSSTYNVLTSFTDAVPAAIASGYEGKSYVINTPDASWYRGMYMAGTGFVNIASFTSDRPNTIADGYFENSTTGKFLLTHVSTQPSQSDFQQLLPRSMITKMLYWVSNCPITSSEPLIDLKVLSKGNAIIIPITNQKDLGNTAGPSSGWSISSTLSINATQIGLGNPANYNVHWASTGTHIIVNNWNSIPITLNGMADMLVIAPS